MVLGVFSLSFDHHLEAYDATSKIQFQPCKLKFLHFFRKSLITATRKCQNNCHSQMGWIDFAILRRQYFRWSTYVPNKALTTETHRPENSRWRSWRKTAHKRNSHQFETVISPCTAGLVIVNEVLLRTIKTDDYSLVLGACANWH